MSAKIINSLSTKLKSFFYYENECEKVNWRIGRKIGEEKRKEEEKREWESEKKEERINMTEERKTS